MQFFQHQEIFETQDETTLGISFIKQQDKLSHFIVTTDSSVTLLENQGDSTKQSKQTWTFSNDNKSLQTEAIYHHATKNFVTAYEKSIFTWNNELKKTILKGGKSKKVS